jgi:hypothetical protein
MTSTTNTPEMFPQLTALMVEYNARQAAEAAEGEAKALLQLEESKQETIQKLKDMGLWEELEAYTTFSPSEGHYNKGKVDATVALPQIYPIVFRQNAERVAVLHSGDSFALPQLPMVLAQARARWRHEVEIVCRQLDRLDPQSVGFEHWASKIAIELYCPERLPELEAKRAINKVWEEKRAQKNRRDEAVRIARARLDDQLGAERQANQGAYDNLYKQTRAHNKALLEQIRSAIPSQLWWRITYVILNHDSWASPILKTVYAFEGYLENGRLSEAVFDVYDPEVKACVKSMFPTAIEITQVNLRPQDVQPNAPIFHLEGDGLHYGGDAIYYPPQWGAEVLQDFLGNYPNPQTAPLPPEVEVYSDTQLVSLAAEILAELEQQEGGA